MQLIFGKEQHPFLVFSACSSESLRLKPETILTCCEALITDGLHLPWSEPPQYVKHSISIFLEASSPQGKVVLESAHRKTDINAVVCQVSSQRGGNDHYLQHFSGIAATTHDQHIPLLARFYGVTTSPEKARLLCQIADEYGAVGVITPYSEHTVEAVLQHARGTVIVETPHIHREYDLLFLVSYLKNIGIHGFVLNESLAALQYPDTVFEALHSMIRWNLSTSDTWDLAQAALLEAY